MKNRYEKSRRTNISKKVSAFFSTFIIAAGLYCAVSHTLKGQSIVAFSENFDNASSVQPWAPYYSTGWINSATSLQSVSGKGKVMKVTFPAGSVGVDHGLGNYRIPLDSAYKELYLSWEYFVPAEFDYGYSDGLGGGKFFGGFAGGSMTAIPNNDATDVDGWASIFIFQNGNFRTYNYFKGSSFSGGWPIGDLVTSIAKGQWRRLTIRLKINDGDQSNGIFEVFDNDILVYQLANAKIVNSFHPEYLIEHIYLNSFFGGSGTGYVSPVTQYMQFDNIVAFYYPKGSAGYRSGLSEKGRTIQVPVAGSYHPVPPNKFRPATYTEAKGSISSHCGFYQPTNYCDGFQTSTIQIAGATQISINVDKFIYDPGVRYSGWKQILKIYQGTGTGRTLKLTFQNGENVTPGAVTITGNAATIEWQSGQGSHNGFSLTYTSNGTGSGKNYVCNNCIASQYTVGTTQTSNIPNAPTNLTISDLTDRSVVLHWIDNSNNESDFEIERTGAGGTEVLKFNSGVNTTSFTSSGMIGNTNYSFRIRAHNVSGYSGYSNVIQLTTNYALPNAPSVLLSTGSTENSVSLKWTDNSGIEDGFKIERSLSSGSGFVEIGTVSPNITTYVSTGCNASTTYYFRVRAFNPAGSTQYTNVIQAATKGLSAANTVYIDPANASDAMQDGTISHPFDSWAKVKWTAGHSYLQKRSTIANEDKILIGSNNVKLGAYGEGELPVVTGTTNSYLISGFEKSGITIRDLELKAPNAVSCIYFIGSSSDSIIIDHCRLSANENAIKINDGYMLVARYNQIQSRNEGIFSTAAFNNVYYNIFEDCYSAININGGTNAKANLFNNVFYNNHQSVTSSYAELILYNNIFYLAENDQQSIKHLQGHIESDNNIYYPEQEGFIVMGGVTYNNLDQIQAKMKTDLKSLAADPMFEDLYNRKFMLKATSPGINAGKNIMECSDIQGIKVPVLKTTDIGAYEYSGELISPKKSGKDNTMQLYPNPSDGLVNIILNLPLDQLATPSSLIVPPELSIIDISGKIIYSQLIQSYDSPGIVQSVDLTPFSDGMYVIFLKFADQVVRDKLVLKH